MAQWWSDYLESLRDDVQSIEFEQPHGAARTIGPSEAR